MGLLDATLLLLLVSVLLLQVARKVGLPYPTLLAGAGVLVALLTGAPSFAIDPPIALTLFIAPALVAAAYDLPLQTVRALRVLLVAFAIGAVVLTALVVAWVVVAMTGTPFLAALVLGAIVAPPDAASAEAVLGAVRVPRRAADLIRAESLFNDATALLLFSGGLALLGRGSLTGVDALRLLAAAPLGVGIGVAAALASRLALRFVAATLGGTLLQFVLGLSVWALAETVHASAVLAVVAYGIAIAAGSGRELPPLVRLHSRTVWSTAVFVLNVVVFGIMGMQARSVVGSLPPAELREAGLLSLAVLGAVVGVRLATVVGFNRLNAWRHRRSGIPEPPPARQALVVGWSGMRGFVTLATAFALPADFPRRDEAVLVAFVVVLGTLLVQGGTLGALIRRLGLEDDAPADEDARNAATIAMARAGLARVEDDPTAPSHLVESYRERASPVSVDPTSASGRASQRAALDAERQELGRLYDAGDLDDGAFAVLQEELDWRELALAPPQHRRVEEG